MMDIDGEILVSNYDFLSNSYMCPVTFKGLTYTSAEAAYQAQKTINPMSKNIFTRLNPSKAYIEGRRVELRPNWDNIKCIIMYSIIFAKFRENPELQEKLLATGDAYIEK